MTQKSKRRPAGGGVNMKKHRGADKTRPAKDTQSAISAQGDLFALFDLVGFGALTNAPADDIGGDVFVMAHRAGSRRFYSANQTSESGTGWQSLPIAAREDAGAMAIMLAAHCGARLDAEASA